jgi:hypothetical protein
MLHPVQNARPKQCQERHVIRKQHQTEWKHPESDQGQKSEDPSKASAANRLESAAICWRAFAEDELPS